MITKQRNPYVLNTSGDELDDQDGDSREQSPLTDEQLVAGFSDIVLSTILATKSDMCGKKFELKIDNVRFVGHPTLLQHPPIIQVSKTDPSPKREMPTMILFNVVFALRANADPSVISCMHNLSRRIAIALQHEERRCQYLTREAKLMLAVQEEITTTETDGSPQSPFRQILPKCKLARDLKEAYDSLCTTGVVRLHINDWLEVSFCLPHKIHRIGDTYIPPEALERSLKAIRPYHALLLLENEKTLLSQLPLDCSPALIRLIKTCSAVKNLQQLAQDADLALLQIFQIAAHLVYWGKAIIIYPLCENNVYMLSPHANICLYSPLAEQFARQFPGHDLPSMLAKFSLPVSLAEFRNPLEAPTQEFILMQFAALLVNQAQLIQMVVWMLQRRLLIQLHTYVCLLVPPSEDEPGLRDEDPPLAARVGGRSLSTPSALSFGSPTSSDDMTLTSPSMENSSAELLTGGDSPLNKRMTETLLASLSEHERQFILNIPAAQNPEDLRMFARLLHYFRGHHHLEEIMYNENMRRSQLKTLFDKFRSVLVVTNHEDPIISIFQSPMD
ncbi:GATOR complex protein NPRL3 isoform X9 [Simochromis diagramma]|uniref:GATOR complex protein NPRL3 isoform X9 n=1 Tax=Simochromis diagramma TaxID=43689 RepID=UPI001A7EC9F3|nr:GATOR complex protein NPRL3 isoform X9 [Simochromis diagramma]